MEDRFSSPGPIDAESERKALPALAIVLFWGGAALLAAKYFKPELLDYIGGDRPELKGYGLAALAAGFLLNLFHMATSRKARSGMNASMHVSMKLPGGGSHTWSSEQKPSESSRWAELEADETTEEGFSADDLDDELRADDSESEEELLQLEEQWSAGKITCEGASAITPIWVLALFVNLVSLPAIVPVTKGVLAGQYGLMVIYLFPILGLLLLGLAMRLTIQRRKFGEQVFEISNRMGRIGDGLKGTVRSTNRPEATGDYVIRLSCRETITTGSGKNRKTRVETHWEKFHNLSFMNYSPGDGLPVAFDIPKGVPESFDEMARGSVRWILSVSAPTPGVDYSAEFHVPVFRRRTKAAQRM